MITDINGYIIFKGQGASIESYGADSYSSDNHSAINNAVNSDYRIIVIPESELPFFISKPVRLISNKTILIKGEVKIKDGYIKSLLADFGTTDTTVQVADAELYFSEGQQVSVSDDNMPIQGGGAGHTRKESDAFEIVSVSGTTITLDSVTGRINIVRPGESYTTSANAKIGHTQSVFITNGKSKIKICGNGIVNDNKDNQYDVEPVNASGEDLEHGCAIAFLNSDNIEVENTEIKNSILHNITLNHVDDVIVNGVNSHHAHDKSILFYFVNYDDNTKTGIIKNSNFNDSQFEDGISLYAQAININIIDCEAKNNGRFGVLGNELCTNVIINGINTTESGMGALIRSAGISFIGSNNILHGDGMYKNKITQYHGTRLQYPATLIKNITVSGGNKGRGALGLINYYDGTIEDVIVKDTIDSDNQGYGVESISDTETTATFNNVTFNNCKQDYNMDANTTLIIT